MKKIFSNSSITKEIIGEITGFDRIKVLKLVNLFQV